MLVGPKKVVSGVAGDLAGPYQSLVPHVCDGLVVAFRGWRGAAAIEQNGV
jgi:hypothetical protein